jgi:hypothetical protein
MHRCCGHDAPSEALAYRAELAARDHLATRSHVVTLAPGSSPHAAAPRPVLVGRDTPVTQDDGHRRSVAVTRGQPELRREQARWALTCKNARGTLKVRLPPPPRRNSARFRRSQRCCQRHALARDTEMTQRNATLTTLTMCGRDVRTCDARADPLRGDPVRPVRRCACHPSACGLIVLPGDPSVPPPPGSGEQWVHFAA